LATVADDDPGTIWTPVALANWYAKGERSSVEVASATTALCYHTGLAPVPLLRWVLVRDAQEEFGPLALLCTDLTAQPAQILKILSWFVSCAGRWR